MDAIPHREWDPIHYMIRFSQDFVVFVDFGSSSGGRSGPIYDDVFAHHRNHGLESSHSSLLLHVTTAAGGQGECVSLYCCGPLSFGSFAFVSDGTIHATQCFSPYHIIFQARTVVVLVSLPTRECDSTPKADAWKHNAVRLGGGGVSCPFTFLRQKHPHP